ncbi:protein of unknown function [Shewanella benthica]|uniref:Uncharacterized protein n=1 Tax=Shewanella benthica TaxID=43661 RepID=A0A330LWU0_9GAMM|nr:protein of unknown function [Shewanella benthica]
MIHNKAAHRQKKQIDNQSVYNTIPYKYLLSSETLSFFNSRRIDEEMVIPF